MSPSVSQSVSQSVSPSVSQSVSQSASQSVSKSQSVKYASSKFTEMNIHELNLSTKLTNHTTKHSKHMSDQNVRRFP